LPEITLPSWAEAPPKVLPVEKPEPVQEVAFVLFQVRVEDPPAEMLTGEAEREAVGAAALDTVTVAEAGIAPLQNVYVDWVEKGGTP